MGCPDELLMMAGEEVYFACEASCLLLGMFGNEARHAEKLQHILSWSSEVRMPIVPGELAVRVHSQATAALRHVRDAMEQAEQEAAIREDVDSAEAGETAHVSACPDDAAAEGELAAPLEETDHGLDKALQESELEALWQEQEELHKTILHSKMDLWQPRRRAPEDGADQADGLVLLCFSRCPGELPTALLESPLAARVAADGVQLQPDWARGRLILATGATEAGISEARGPWHVAVRAADEGEVLDVLRACLGRQRPRLKCDGRFRVPGDASLFGDVSASEPAAQPRAQSAAEWSDILVVERTFLHARLAPEAPAQRSASAPPRL